MHCLTVWVFFWNGIVLFTQAFFYSFTTGNGSSITSKTAQSGTKVGNLNLLSRLNGKEAKFISVLFSQQMYSS